MSGIDKTEFGRCVNMFGAPHLLMDLYHETTNSTVLCTLKKL